MRLARLKAVRVKGVMREARGAGKQIPPSLGTDYRTAHRVPLHFQSHRKICIDTYHVCREQNKRAEQSPVAASWCQPKRKLIAKIRSSYFMREYLVRACRVIIVW